MDATQYLATLVDPAVMRSHRESYRNWKVQVEISGDSCFAEGGGGVCYYVPRIVVTEQLSIGFRELEVATDRYFLTPALCLQGGLAIARNFIDMRA